MDNRPTCHNSEDAIIEAEAQCHKKITEVLGLRIGETSFLSVNGRRLNCVVWDIGALETGDQAGFPSDMYHFQGRLDLYNQNRAALQRWIMRLLLSFPVNKWQGRSNDLAAEGNVYCLRVAPQTQGIGEITTKELRNDKNVKVSDVFTASVIFDVVFSAKEAEEE